MKRCWPWVAWGAAGLVLEAVALGTGLFDPLTRVVIRARRHQVGRIIYEAADIHFRGQ